MPEPQTANNNINNAQMLELLKQFAAELRKPSDEELEKKAVEQERKKAAAKAAIQTANEECTNRLQAMRICPHKNPKCHTFVANILPNGDAIAVCQRCGKDFTWEATDAQKMQGVNLFEYKFLDEATLRAWEKSSPAKAAIPDRVKLGTRAGMTEVEAKAI